MKITALKNLILIPYILFGLTTTGYSKITFYTEEYKPFNYNENGQSKGMAIDILSRITDGKANAIFVPWARAFSKATKEKNTVVFSTSRTKDREDKFKWACPIYTDNLVLFTMKSGKYGKNLTVNEVKNLEIGVVSKSVGEDQALKVFNIKQNKLKKVSDYKLNIRKVMKGKIDGFIMSSLSLSSLAKKMNIDTSKFNEAYTLSENDLCFAFNKTTDEAEFSQFQMKLKSFITTPEYKKIINNYLK